MLRVTHLASPAFVRCGHHWHSHIRLHLHWHNYQ